MLKIFFKYINNLNGFLKIKHFDFCSGIPFFFFIFWSHFISLFVHALCVYFYFSIKIIDLIIIHCQRIKKVKINFTE